jgi:hypothetical protein
LTLNGDYLILHCFSHEESFSCRKLALYPLSDDSGKVGVYVDMIKVKASSENFSVRVSSFAKMGDGRLEKLEKFSKEASRLFKNGERVMKIRGDFMSSNSAVSVTELLFEASFPLPLLNFVLSHNFILRLS